MKRLRKWAGLGVGAIVYWTRRDWAAASVMVAMSVFTNWTTGGIEHAIYFTGACICITILCAARSVKLAGIAGLLATVLGKRNG